MLTFANMRDGKDETCRWGGGLLAYRCWRLGMPLIWLKAARRDLRSMLSIMLFDALRADTEFAVNSIC